MDSAMTDDCFHFTLEESFIQKAENTNEENFYYLTERWMIDM